MGVPVVTCPGETFASRHSLSHLANANATSTTADSLDAYVDRAIALANDVDELRRLHASLRPTMADSPVCDLARYARDFEELIAREVAEHRPA